MVVREESSHAEIDRILHSDTFRNSDVLRRLLRFLADKTISGEADQLKEYAIGIDALGKPSSYDRDRIPWCAFRWGACGRSLPNTTALRVRAIPWLSTFPRGDSN
jgi:hypothetical protein